MYTRCPACQAVYELNAPTLAEAAGVVRCGNCGKTFNSLTLLFALHPDEGEEPLPSGGMPPMLEHPDLIQAELPVDFDPPEAGTAVPDSDDDPALADTGSHAVPTWLWPGISGLLAVLLAAQTWWMWQSPGSPMARWLGSDSELAVGDPNELVQIVSRDLHPHPSLDDAVMVSLSLRNQGARRVAFPIIELRFFDASQQVLGVRRLDPDEYLSDTDLIDRGMTPGVIVPLLMEFVIGSTEPSGFQIRFY